MPCESALQQYFAAMDGTKKSEFEHHFDALFHESFEMISRHGKVISLEDVKTVFIMIFLIITKEPIATLHIDRLFLISSSLALDMIISWVVSPTTLSIIHQVALAVLAYLSEDSGIQ